MKLAIVILNWNGEKHLKNYLPSIIQNTPEFDCDIIVADNGSTDQSIAFLEANYPQIRVIAFAKNYGFAGGYNKALKHVDADIFCILNSDVRVTAHWIDPILTLFDTDKNIAAIQPKILSDRDTDKFEHAGAAGGFIDKFGYPFCRGRIMDAIETDKNQYNQNTEIFWASGACLFIRSEIFKASGGFDADFFAHMEEIDLCWRLKNQGYRILYCSESKVYHYGGATLDYNNPHKLYLNFRNSLWTLYKNYTGKNRHWIMFQRKCIDTMAILKFFIALDFKNSTAIIHAHLSYYRSRLRIRVKRKQLQAKVVTQQHPEIYQKSIVWQFFIGSKRAFLDYKDFNFNK